MWKLLLGLALAVGVRSAWSDCTDTTILLKSGTTGFTPAPGAGGAATATYDPTSLNGLIRGCVGNTMTVRLNIDATESGRTRDTVKLTGPIVIAGRAGKTTSLSMLRPAALNGALDSIFTFVENGTSPQLLIDSANNLAVISNMAFARKVLNNGGHTVDIQGKGSQVSACHFWMADKDGTSPGALLSVTADSVLVERSLFRAPPDGVGLSRAIRAVGTGSGFAMNKLEVRANVFFSTGVFIAMNGPFHLLANTFVGSRNAYYPVIISGAIGTNYNNAVIMHNLFAAKVDTLSPIAFNVSGSVATDSIIRNAWSQGKPNLPLAVTDPGGTTVTVRASGANQNVALAKGFSNYSPTAPDVKDYPLTQLRTDPTLARRHPDFGKVYRVFQAPGTSSWAGTMADVSALINRTYFPNFISLLGNSWTGTNVKVGAFVAFDTLTVPSPLAAGTQGTSLSIKPDSIATDKARISEIRFDAAYYGGTQLPEYMYFFFSDTLAKLTASNDTTALFAAGNQGYSRRWSGFDSLLTVPKEVRNGADVDIYVKMLQYRGNLRAPVLSSAAIGTLRKMPGFPSNDLTLTQTAVDNATRTITLKVARPTPPGETIDSVRIEAYKDGGQLAGSKSVSANPASGLNAIPFTVGEKGNYSFKALPVAGIGVGKYKAGSATTASTIGPVSIGLASGDSVYVTLRASGCTSPSGRANDPYCHLDSALKAIASNNGGTIFVRSGTSISEPITIAPASAADTNTLSIVVDPAEPKGSRPVIRGTAGKEAVTITRKNVVLRGFTLEQPAGSGKSAVAVKAGGSLIEANIFRPATSAGAVNAPAIGLEVGSTASARVINNVVWGFNQGLSITASSSQSIKIMFNTFVADSALNKGSTTGILAAGTDTVSPVIANNFFSGFADPIDVSLSAPQNRTILDHNVYTAGANLHGLTESGGLGPSTGFPATDIWTGDYLKTLNEAFEAVVNCSSIRPCNPIYAGSSTNDYNVSVATDVFGNPRKNRKEVGAYELPSPPSGVLGVVAIRPALVPGTFRQINYSVSGKSFDPDSTETDSVWVLWTDSDVSGSGGNILSVIPANQRHRYSIKKLVAGNIDGTADIDKELKKYWFYAVLSRGAGETRKLGYPYSDTIISSPNLLFGDCSFADSKTACPSESGVFGVKDGQFQGAFETRVRFKVSVDSGEVKLPTFVDNAESNKYNLDLNSPFNATFKFDLRVQGLGSNPKQRAVFEIDLPFNPQLTGLDLFLLPESPTGLARLVPDWSIAPSPSGGTKYRLTFESTTYGPQSYAFGKLQSALAPGSIAVTGAEPKIFDFKEAAAYLAANKDSSNYPVPIGIKGLGFKTGNPLVLISTIPAGGTVNPGASGKPKVISKGYPVKTLVASSGYAGLGDSLRDARLYQLYLKACAAEAASPVPKGQRKPFTLDSVSYQDFLSTVVPMKADLSIGSGGDMPDMTVNVPLVGEFKEQTLYSDGTGKASRSREVVFTVFDGSRITRTRGFIRTRFTNDNLQPTEWHNRLEFARSTNAKPHWNLYGYPWDELDSGSLARMVGQEKWDRNNMRLMWYKGTGTGAASFAAYDGTNASEIKYDSGMAAWSGSTRAYTPQFIQGTSLDYQPFRMSLSPNVYYDVSLPFNFPMKWQDILDSSGLTAATAPSMWHFNDAENKWEAVQAPTAGSPASGSILLPWEGYTVRSASPVTLVFPVADTSRTESALPKVSAGGESWAVKVEASDATAAMELRIGRDAREMVFPEPPDVPGQDFRVALVKGEEKVSHHILPLEGAEGGWQGHWPLRGTAAKGSGGIALRIAEATRPVPVWLVDALHLTAVPLSAETSVRIGEEELKANDYHLVAGDKGYVDGLMQNLNPGRLMALSNYPNPFSGSTLIRYALPAGFGKTAFEMKVRDFRGRTVWEKTIVAGNSLSYLWDGNDRAGHSLPAGVYSLSLTAKTEDKAVHRAVRNLLRM